jgi:hypothetical protein
MGSTLRQSITARTVRSLRRASVGASILLALTACGSQHPTAPQTGPPPPDVTVDWAGMQGLYDDPLYRRLPLLLDDESVTRSLDAAMSALVAGVHAKDLATVKQALTAIHDTREAYENRLGGDHHEQPQLIALSLFEIRGMAYIQYDSLGRRDVQFVTEDGQ